MSVKLQVIVTNAATMERRCGTFAHHYPVPASLAERCPTLNLTLLFVYHASLVMGNGHQLLNSWPRLGSRQEPALKGEALCHLALLTSVKQGQHSCTAPCADSTRWSAFWSTTSCPRRRRERSWTSPRRRPGPRRASSSTGTSGCATGQAWTPC